jgi:hypothetical protein
MQLPVPAARRLGAGATTLHPPPGGTESPLMSRYRGSGDGTVTGVCQLARYAGVTVPAAAAALLSQ